MRVRDVMTKQVYTAAVSDTVATVGRRLLAERITAMPVLDASGRLVGLISRTDVMRALGMAAESLEARDLMSCPVECVKPQEDIAAVAERMLDLGLRHAPVVDDEGVVVGMLSHPDIIRAFVLCDDEAITARARTAVEEFLAYSLRADVLVRSLRGIVTLHGRVPTRADALALTSLVARVEGVVAVDDRLESERESFLDSSRYFG